jgi:hypothetical protein
MSFDVAKILSFEGDLSIVDKSDGLALLTHTDKISVAWPIPTGSEREVVEWVQKNRLYVRNQTIRNERLDGFWRSSGWEVTHPDFRSRDKAAFIQTFRRGYALEYKDTEAFLLGISQSANAEDRAHSVVWPNIRPDKADGVHSALLARGTLTNPTFGKSTLTGRFVISGLQDTLQQNDGAHNITGTLTKVNAIDDTPADDLAALKFEKRKVDTILNNGEFEEGNGKVYDYIWKGLDPESESNCLLLRNQVAEFVTNVVGETVNAWTGDTVVNSLYDWTPPTGTPATDWVGRKRDLVVEARRVFTMTDDNKATALRYGWVTRAWELLPIETSIASDGTLTLTVRTIEDRWKNIEFTDDVNKYPQADQIIFSKSNEGGHVTAQTLIASGVPSDVAEELINRISASGSDFIIGSQQIQQSGTLANVTTGEGKTYDYRAGDPLALTSPVHLITVYDINNQRGSQVSVWPRIAPDKADAHETLLKAPWTNADSSNYLLDKLKRDEENDGAITFTLYTAQDDSLDTNLFFNKDGLYDTKTFRRVKDGQEYFAFIELRYRVRLGSGLPGGWDDYGSQELKTPTPLTYYDPGYPMQEHGSWFNTIGRNRFYFKKVYQMYQDGSEVTPETFVWKKVAEPSV